MMRSSSDGSTAFLIGMTVIVLLIMPVMLVLIVLCGFYLLARLVMWLANLNSTGATLSDPVSGGQVRALSFDEEEDEMLMCPKCQVISHKLMHTCGTRAVSMDKWIESDIDWS